MSLRITHQTRKTASKKSQAVKRLATSVFAAAIVLPFFSSTAMAADYRYWTFWTAGPTVECKTPQGGTALVCEQIDTGEKWAFAQVGAQDIKPVDQTVIGWRFAISTPDGSEEPAEPASFTKLCPAMSEPVSDQHRVAVVIDFGTANIAPAGETPPTPNNVECVSLEVGQSAADALVLATSEVRGEGGFVCGINGYPTEECGLEVDAADFAPDSSGAGTASEETPDGAVTDVVAIDEASANNSPGWIWPVVGLVVLVSLTVIFIAARRGKSKA